MKLDFKSLPAEKLSQRLLYCLVAAIVAVFGLFYFVGYDMPYDENPDFNAPLFMGALIWFSLLLIVCAAVAALFSAVKAMRVSSSEKIENGIPVKKISYITAASTGLMLAITFAFGSSSPLSINGKMYSDAFWLKAADMFVSTSLILLFAAIAAVVYGSTRYIRKKQRGKQC